MYDVTMTADLFDDPRLTAMGLLIETYSGLTTKLIGVFKEHGLTGSDFDVLIRLARSPRQSLRLTDLAAQTSLSTSGITRVIDRLERSGLAARASCPGDRRAFLVVLTEEGNQRLAGLVPSLTAGIERWFTGVLSPEQLEEFLEALRALRASVHPGAIAGIEEFGECPPTTRS